MSNTQNKLGTLPVFLTSISSILGAILFLRMGYATGVLGFFGVLTIIILGHLITIPTALAISELATNTRVEGGGEYFIISRSFGLNIGTTIGLALYLSQAISIAFYIISFTEAFNPILAYLDNTYGFTFPKQIISIPTFLILAYLTLKKGTGSGMKLLYIVNGILLISLICFFLGQPLLAAGVNLASTNFHFYNGDIFFLIFAICFPAFTGMTSGVGLSGDLKNPGKSIPLGTILGTITGLIVYLIVIFKFSFSATHDDLTAYPDIMSEISLFGYISIPLGLAAATLSSSLGFMLIAPRTLQAICNDKTLPIGKINDFFSKGKEHTNEPINASILTFAITFVFLLLGDVDSVAQIITMFFLITYGTLCLISFLNHFGAPPSYRPRFKSHWFISLLGFIVSLWVIFKINALYALISYLIIGVIYITIYHFNKENKGLVSIFKSALFQINRQLQIYLQKDRLHNGSEEWRPAAVCISEHSFERPQIIEFMNWISYQHGFGMYFHFIKDFYCKQTYTNSKEILHKLIDNQKDAKTSLYIDTMISPSYTSAIAQIIQSPSISGMENNLIVFEYEKGNETELTKIVENVNLVKSGDFDVCIYAINNQSINDNKDIHVWIREYDDINMNFMILLGYLILSHPKWNKSMIKIFITSIENEDHSDLLNNIREKIKNGRLPITLTNISIVPINKDLTFKNQLINISKDAGLVIAGFSPDLIKKDATNFFNEFNEINNVLFVNTSEEKIIK